MEKQTVNIVRNVGRWAARGLVVAVFLMWGAFFVEHISEWFVAPFPQVPPLKVCLFQLLHLTLLAGLLASLWWPRLGLAWVTLAALAFFLPVAKGMNGLLFAALTILPVALLVAFQRRESAPTDVTPAPV